MIINGSKITAQLDRSSKFAYKFDCDEFEGIGQYTLKLANVVQHVPNCAFIKKYLITILVSSCIPGLSEITPRRALELVYPLTSLASDTKNYITLSNTRMSFHDLATAVYLFGKEILDQTESVINNNDLSLETKDKIDHLLATVLVEARRDEV